MRRAFWRDQRRCLESILNVESLYFASFCLAHLSAFSFSWNLWKHITSGLGGRPSCGFGPSDRCARSSSGGFSKTSWPMTSINISDTNLTVDWPFPLFSGTFKILRFALRDRFSKSSTRSISVAFCSFRVLIVFSATDNAEKLSLASVSVAHRRDWKLANVSVKAFTDVWSGTIDSWIRTEMSSFIEARCFVNSVTSWFIETPSLSAGVSSDFRFALAMVANLLAMLVLVVGGAFTTDLFLLILLYQPDCTKHCLDHWNGTIKAYIIRKYRELSKHSSSPHIAKPEAHGCVI